MSPAALPLLLIVALAAAAPSGAPRMDHEARGRFDVDLRPLEAPGAGLGRMSIDKRFHGDLEATSKGEMLSAGAPQKGVAGYVAMEAVTGALNGRKGGFALQHSGAMDAGGQSLSVRVAPGSGSGELVGIAGEMTIDVAAGHAYVLRYSLPKGE